MQRVLRSGGEAVIVDLRHDVSLSDLDHYIAQSGRRRFDAWMTRWAFRSFLIRRAYTLDGFTRLADQSRSARCLPPDRRLDRVRGQARQGGLTGAGHNRFTNTEKSP